MYLKVEEAIDSIKSSILATSFTRSFYREQKPSKQKKIWSGIEDGLKIFKLYRRFLIIEFALTLVLAKYFILLLTYYQLSLQNDQNQEKWILLTINATSVVLVGGSILRYQARKQLSLERRQQPTDTFLLVIEVLLLLIQPYPFFNQVQMQRISMSNEIINPLKLNHFLIVLSLTKLVFLIRGILNYLTPYGNPRHYRVCKIYGVTNDPFYHIRSLFRQHPVILISILYIVCMLLFAYCYRVFQRGAEKDTTLDDMSETLWLAVLTMTTVGYGDVKPHTSIGVIITVISSFTGVIGTSLFVLSITNNLQLSYGEQRTLQILRRFRNKRQHKGVSAMYIRVCLWRIWKQYKSKQKIQISSEERKLKRELREMKQEDKRSLKQSALFQQFMQHQFQLVRSQINSILQNYHNMLEECSNREQVIEGILRNLGNYKEDIKKMELFMSGNEYKKQIQLPAEMVINSTFRL